MKHASESESEGVYIYVCVYWVGVGCAMFSAVRSVDGTEGDLWIW